MELLIMEKPFTKPEYVIPISRKDPVNPSHYKKSQVECIEAIKAALSPNEFTGFLKGNILKYVWRESQKNGLEDLKKAQWYLEKLIDFYEP